MVRDRYSTYMVCVWCMVVCVRGGVVIHGIHVVLMAVGVDRN